VNCVALGPIAGSLERARSARSWICPVFLVAALAKVE